MTINGLLPGRMWTDRLTTNIDFQAKKAGKTFEEQRLASIALIPAGRHGTIEEFGAYCAFLCSMPAGYVTGQNLLVDGGMYPGTL